MKAIWIWLSMIVVIMGHLFTTSPVYAANDPQINAGALQVYQKDGQLTASCPLKHTDVKVEISGFLARVVVTQEFENTFNDKIEAVYTFPLSQNGAVDDMRMVIGGRVIKGEIKKREEARQIYDQARRDGKVASLLDQERHNIFTQSIANIMPGENIKVMISYVETLKYDAGSYEFSFPMVVGPRYIPGAPVSKQANGFAPDTDQVNDASRITPMPTPEGVRAGHDISLEVELDAGVAIRNIKSKLHDIDINRTNNHAAFVRLKNLKEIPNRDFILKYDVAGEKIQDGIMLHRSKKGGFFTLILQPPDQIPVEEITPKELVFVIDTSGSMHGFPLDKAKETMNMAMAGLNPQDRFNLITFSGDTHILFEKPVAATVDNLAKAQQFLQSRQGGGGTEMMKAIRAALDPSDSQQHIRIVCFMTDGYVGNDQEIIGEIQRHPNARIFSFGIGNSVNRFLLDKMSEVGRGEVEYVTLTDDGSKAAVRFHERIRNPLLTDINIDWNGMPISDVYPKRIPDMFSAKPVILTGRFNAGGRGMIKMKGRFANRELIREIIIDLPQEKAGHKVISTLWARNRVDELMKSVYDNKNRGTNNNDVVNEITQLGLDYRILTQYTSFVAVEERVVTDGSDAKRVDVPVEMPSGVSRDGVFGKDKEDSKQLGDPAIGFIGGTTVGATGVPRQRVENRSEQSRNGQGAAKGRVPESTLKRKSNEDFNIGGGDPAYSTTTTNKAAAPKPVTKTEEKTSNYSERIIVSPTAPPPPSNGPGDGKGLGTGTGGNTKTGEVAQKEQEKPQPKEPAKITATDESINAQLQPYAAKFERQLFLLLTSKQDDHQLSRLRRAVIKNGKITVTVKLNKDSKGSLQALKQAGFVQHKMYKDGTLVGTIDIDKLIELAKLDFVKLIGTETHQ